jgi:hypothetical protein
MSDPLRLRPLGEHAALVRDRLAALTGAEFVDDPDCAELVVMTPEDLAELIEDAAATAAYQRTRDQESCRSPSSTAAPYRRGADDPSLILTRSLAGEEWWRHSGPGRCRGIAKRPLTPALSPQAGRGR